MSQISSRAERANTIYQGKLKQAIGHAETAFHAVYWRIPFPDSPQTKRALRIGRRACVKALDGVLGPMPRNKTTREAIAVAYILHIHGNEALQRLRRLQNDFYWAVEFARKEYCAKFQGTPYWPCPWPEECVWGELRGRYLYGQDQLVEKLGECARVVVAATAPNTPAGLAYLELLAHLRKLAEGTRDQLKKITSTIVDDATGSGPI